MDFGCTHEILDNSFSGYRLTPKEDVTDCWSTLFVSSKVSEMMGLAFLILFKNHFIRTSAFLASVPMEMELR